MTNLVKNLDPSMGSNEKTVSSKEIAELTGKLHKNILESIRSMEPAWVEVTGLTFKLSEYVDTTGRKLPMYELSKNECLYVATKFNDEARARLILRWDELEAQARILSKKELLLMNLEAEERNEALEADLSRKDELIKSQAPKVLFADSVTESKSSVLIKELAGYLKQNGIDIGQNRLYEWLREHEYLCKKGDYYNLPTQKSLDLGVFDVKKRVINNPDGTVIATSTTKVTGKGLQYFINKFLKNKEAA